MYPPDHQGGYELVWADAVAHLLERGHTVRVLCSDHREPAARTLQTGARYVDQDVFRELRWYWHDHRFPRLGVRARLELERANGEAFDRHVAELRPDVIAWWAMGGMSLSLIERARRAGLPAVAFVNDDWLIYGPRVDAWTRLARRLPVPAPLLERAVGVPARFEPARAFERIVFASEAVRESALEHLPLGATEVAYGGIDPAFLAESSPRDDWSWRLLSVGRIDPRKGIATAIEALALLPAQASLRIVGPGDARHLAELERAAMRAGVAERVHFDGPRARADLPQVYAESDVVVFPVDWREPWGLVPLEAMASSRPVVATGTGGSREYLSDGVNCLLFAPGDAAALAAALRTLASGPELRTRLCAAGLETARANTNEAFHARVEATLAAAAARASVPEVGQTGAR